MSQKPSREEPAGSRPLEGRTGPHTPSPEQAHVIPQAIGNALPPGTRLGEFELLGVVGEGGFGIVYRAWDRALDRAVAIKEYLPASLAVRVRGVQVSLRSQNDAETFLAGLSSFVKEAQMLAKFDHPALLKVYRFWESNGSAYMVMPFYEGRTLRDELRKRAGVPDQETLLSWLGPVADALAVIHAEHWYHRDVAPDNVMLLADSNRPLLLDFGAARRVIGDMTQTLTVILKPGYAPVEQYGEMPDMKQGPWTDVYALAALAHFALRGRAPPPSVERLVQDRYEALAGSALEGLCSTSVLAAIDRALEIRPERRTQSMEAFKTELGLPPPIPSGPGDHLNARGTPAMGAFVTPVRQVKATTKTTATRWQRFKRLCIRIRGPLVAVAGVGAVLSGLVGWYTTYRVVVPVVLTTADKQTVEPLSLLVLPFVNLTEDASQEYVAAGMTASITADLSRIRGAYVVDAKAAASVNPKGLTGMQVAAERGVRFVLQGNVQRSGSRIRVGAQLLDSATNAQLWSESFEGDSSDLFELQDRVTLLVGNSMGRELVVRAARASESRKGNASLTDLMLRARALQYRPGSLESGQEAEVLYRQALTLDPGNVEAALELARSLANQVYNFGYKLNIREAERKLAEAIDLSSRIANSGTESDNPHLYRALGAIASVNRDREGQLLAAERLLALEPKSISAHMSLGELHYYRGDGQRSLALAKLTLALDPKHPSLEVLNNLAASAFMVGDYDATIRFGLKAQVARPSAGLSTTLAAAYALKGEREKATEAVAAALKDFPELKLSSAIRRYEDPSENFAPAYRKWALEQKVPAMRLAGFPE